MQEKIQRVAILVAFGQKGVSGQSEVRG